MQHALAAQAFDLAATLVEQAAPEMIQRSELARLLTWIDTLPDGEVQARPQLALYYAWSLLLSGKTKQAAVHLEAIEAMLAADEAKQTPEVQGHTAAMRARLLRESGDLAATIALSRQGLAQLPEKDTMLRMRITLDLTIAHYLLGEFEPASQLLMEAITTGPNGSTLAQHLIGYLHQNTNPPCPGSLGSGAAALSGRAGADLAARMAQFPGCSAFCMCLTAICCASEMS